jgi:hypothetical protein
MLEWLLVISATALYIIASILIGEVLDQLSKASWRFITKLAH